MTEPLPSDARHRRLTDLRAGNEQREKNLVQQGVKFGGDLVAKLNIETLKDLFLGDDESLRLDFDIRYQERLAEVLANIEAEVATQQARSKLVIAAPQLNGHRR